MADYHVHIGPYLLCKNSMVDKEKTRRSCTNVLCANREREFWDANKNFCELCGQSIGMTKYTAKAKKVDTNPWLVDESLAPLSIRNLDLDKNTDIWVSNHHRPNKDKVRTFSFDAKYDGEQYYEITPELITAEINEFSEQYKDAIAKLRELYGSENVTMKWGLIHEIS